MINENHLITFLIINPSLPALYEPLALAVSVAVCQLKPNMKLNEIWMLIKDKVKNNTIVVVVVVRGGCLVYFSKPSSSSSS